MAEVAVAVVSWNTRELLERCLGSLAPEHEAGRAEVWVVDNGSSDGSPELVRERFPWVSLVEPGENLGFGRAVNLVAERTRSDWIAPANADVELEPGALETLLAAGRAHPEAGCVAPRLVLPDGSTQHSVYAFPTVPYALAVNSGAGRLVPGLGDRLCLLGQWDPERPREVGWPVGAFLIVRRAAWDEAGGFDESQWLFAEDLDLGWRLHRAGWKRRYEPGAVVRHHESAATGEAFGAERTARTMEATYTWMARRRGTLRTRTAAGIACASMLARLSLAAPLSKLGANGWDARRDRARFWLDVHRRGLTPRDLSERLPR